MSYFIITQNSEETERALEAMREEGLVYSEEWWPGGDETHCFCFRATAEAVDRMRKNRVPVRRDHDPPPVAGSIATPQPTHISDTLKAGDDFGLITWRKELSILCDNCRQNIGGDVVEKMQALDKALWTHTEQNHAILESDSDDTSDDASKDQ